MQIIKQKMHQKHSADCWGIKNERIKRSRQKQKVEKQKGKYEISRIK